MACKLFHLCRREAIPHRTIARTLKEGGHQRAGKMRGKLQALLGEVGGKGAPRGKLRADLEALVVEGLYNDRRWVEEVVNAENERRNEQLDRRIRILHRQLAEREEALEQARSAGFGLRAGYRDLQASRQRVMSSRSSADCLRESWSMTWSWSLPELCGQPLPSAMLPSVSCETNLRKWVGRS